jgi:hypothetical protein
LRHWLDPTPFRAPIRSHYGGGLLSLYLYVYDALTLAGADESAMNRRRSSQNAVKPKFAEYLFHALGCIRARLDVGCAYAHAEFREE